MDTYNLAHLEIDPQRFAGYVVRSTITYYQQGREFRISVYIPMRIKDIAAVQHTPQLFGFHY